MFSTLAVFGYIAAFIAPGLCCHRNEYETRDGNCCPKCHKGTVVQRNCSAQSGMKCIACTNGTFMNQPNGLTNCFPCTSCDQGHGLFALKECTATTDTICDVLTGYFCKVWTDGTGCSVAQKHAKCEPGHRTKEPGTSRNDTECELCPPGFFSRDGLNCTVWTNCSETQVQITEGSGSSDVVCASIYIFLAFLILPVIGALVIAGFWISGKLHSRKTDRHTENTHEAEYHHVPGSEMEMTDSPQVPNKICE